MNILIIGNVIKDVYLNLDSRNEQFETDQHGTTWLDLAFNASEHHYFSRNPSLGGAAVSLEVLEKLGLDTSIYDTTVSFPDDRQSKDTDPTNYRANTYRYILITNGQVSYFVPSKFQTTTFTASDTPYDFIYVDRSANLTESSIQELENYLENHPKTKLVLYLHTGRITDYASILPRTDLVFTEKHPSTTSFSEKSSAPRLRLDPYKTIYLSDQAITYAELSVPISINRVDILTHLSAYSIAAATILGAFILGYSIEDSLKMAKINTENSRLDSVLSLEELQRLSSEPINNNSLSLIAASLVLHPKGILAADESGGSIHKKFDQLNIPDTYDNRRDYRNIFFTTKDLEKYVNGVILFDETARQFADNGQNFVDYLTARRIIPGIKVDQGLEKFADSLPTNYDSKTPANPDETWTKGLDHLGTRLKEYYQMGLRFAKWRAAFEIRLDDNGKIITPTDTAIKVNCQILAEYAKICQSNQIVPIVEPEVVYDGNYSIDQNAEITGKILDQLFKSLRNANVDLDACILKCNMVLAGKQFNIASTPQEVGQTTAKVLKEHVPDTLAGIVFLSGGQTTEQATNNLAAIIQNGPFPWPVTFSFARALQDPALYAWKGDNKNTEKARQAFLDRLIANSEVL